MKSKKAFTLIELLVVIAIIGLLMAIIVPALRKVKKQAAAIVCLSNMRSLAACWHTYAMDNDEKMVNGHVPTWVNPQANHWIEAPENQLGGYTGDLPGTGSQLPVEDELRGIRKGLLFPYVDAVDVYHCPAERTAQLFAHIDTAQYGSFWNSYSITGLMNGESCKETYDIYSWGNGYNKDGALKISEIQSPGDKVVFLENTDYRGWLLGSWIMGYNANPIRWIDYFAIWHGDQSPLGFADGHAETHRWVEQSTYDMCREGAFDVIPPDTELEDILYMTRRYVP